MSVLKSGDVVKNIAGREKEKLYLVLKVDKQFVYIIDGKNRRIENPKRKNKKHLLKINVESIININSLSKDLDSENAKIRKEIRRLSMMEVVNV